MNKKVILGLLAVSVGMASCNRDEDAVSSQGEPVRTVHYTPQQIESQLQQLNESFQISGKSAVNLEYSYKAYAEPPRVNSIRTNATSVSAINDMVFVTWHTLNAPYGGALTAYKLNSSTDKYEFTDRIDFLDTDFHESATHRNAGNGTYELAATGQRNPDASNYLLSGHKGAVVTRVDYDYINDAFVETSVKELPLPGYAGNSIVSAGESYIVITGNGTGSTAAADQGGVYRTDYDLTNISEAMSLNDGLSLLVHPGTLTTTTSANLTILERTGANSYAYDALTADNNPGVLAGSFSPAFSFNASVGTDVERAGMCWAVGSTGSSTHGDSLLFALGDAGLYSAGSGLVANHGAALSVAYDQGARAIYYAGGTGGLSVLAGGGFDGGALINTFDLIGKFTPPTNGSFPSDFDIKDVSVYGSRNIALASGLGGMYFIRRD